MKKTGIVQGDAYVLPIVITTGDTIITDSLATAVRIKIGKYSASWPGGKISYSAGKWLFPLSQEQTQNLSAGKDEYQVQVQFAGGQTIGSAPLPVGVIKSVLRGTFGEELEASSKSIVELKQLNAYISDVDISVEGGMGSPYAVLFVPQTLTEVEQEQARENIGAGAPYVLPEATKTELGGIKLGNGLVRDEEGNTGVDPSISLSPENIEELMGENLEYSGGKINVLTASAPEEDNTKPITAAAVQETIGNINILLSTI